MHAVMRRASTLSASVSAVVVSGLVFGISKTPVTPPMTAPREPVSRSSLWVRPGLAEMHLGVDDAGQDVQAAAVDRFRRPKPRQVADRGDVPGADADIAHALAVLIDDGAALEDQIVSFRHSLAVIHAAPIAQGGGSWRSTLPCRVRSNRPWYSRVAPPAPRPWRHGRT